MRKLSSRGRHACMLAVAVLAVCGAAQGSNGDNPGDAAPTPEVRPDDIKGQYEFGGGRQLTITGSAYRIHAQLDGHPDLLLVRNGPAVFTAADGSFTLTFKPHENGLVHVVELDEASGRTAANAVAAAAAAPQAR